MYTRRVYNPISILIFTYKKILAIAIWSSIIVLLYTEFDFEWVRIPWVPLTLIGIAVAFYLGFKNNSAYERGWEARKIWGAIVNSSRSWGMMVKGFVTDEFAGRKVDKDELAVIHKRMIYRHIAWLYRLKRQLRVIKSWEHIRKENDDFRKLLAERFPEMDPEKELKVFIENDEANSLLGKKNVAAQIIYHQSEDLRNLKRAGLIDDFRHMEMEKLLVDFYTQQGKCERLKNYPLPRQYATVSIYFFYIFILLLPSGLLSAFDGYSANLIWLVVPFSVLIGWIFYLMELVGDYAENPFENLAFDTPMTSLTRTIEIDLREMLGETDLPEPIGPVKDVLM